MLERTESVASVTSMLVNVKLNDERPIQDENERLRDLLHEKTSEVSHYREKSEKYKADAMIWDFAKKNYFIKLGFDNPKELEKKVKEDMKKQKEISGVK